MCVCVCVLVCSFVIYVSLCFVCVCGSLLLHPSVECGSVRALVIVPVHGAWVGEGGDVVHSGQHAHACSTELPAAQCRASQPVSQLDNYRIHSHDSISESYLQLA